MTTLTPPPRLLLVHAHPDDETIWTGGTIARYAASGVRVTVVTCTLGEEGEVIPEDLRRLVSDQADQLGGYRVGELRAACAELGVADQRFLGGMGSWRDSGMQWERPGIAGALPGAHPRAFVAGDRGVQADQLEAVLREVEPQVVVTYASDGGYGHPDHVRAHEVTMTAAARVPEVHRVFHVVPSEGVQADGLAELGRAPDLPFALPRPHELPSVADERITTVVDVGEHLPAKLGALRAHRTQVRVWEGAEDGGAGVAALALSNDVAQPLVDTEHFVLAAGTSEGCAHDLFGGLEVGGTERAEHR
ncbi:N-acetyl-1-D-myo-inositol-2-amino-2-deoxy-alpha-D-glucopyranoside deacetylase [Parasphingorhabdus pacifica]